MVDVVDVADVAVDFVEGVEVVVAVVAVAVVVDDDDELAWDDYLQLTFHNVVCKDHVLVEFESVHFLSILVGLKDFDLQFLIHDFVASAYFGNFERSHDFLMFGVFALVGRSGNIQPSTKDIFNHKNKIIE